MFRSYRVNRQGVPEGTRDSAKARGERCLGNSPVALAQGEQFFYFIWAEHIVNGVSDFTAGSARMVSEFGNGIKAHLETIYEEAKKVAANLESKFTVEDAKESVAKTLKEGGALTDARQPIVAPSARPPL